MDAPTRQERRSVASCFFFSFSFHSHRDLSHTTHPVRGTRPGNAAFTLPCHPSAVLPSPSTGPPPKIGYKVRGPTLASAQAGALRTRDRSTSRRLLP